MNTFLRLLLLNVAVAAVVASSPAGAEDKQPTPPKPKVEVKPKDLDSGDKLLDYDVQDATGDIKRRDPRPTPTTSRSSR